LQESEIERVGGSEVIKVDVRVVAATNKDLKQESEKGRFRADLFDRLNVVPIEVPALRDRKEDIPSLVEHFLREDAPQLGRRVQVARDAMGLLLQHDWPGNVRELRNTIERLCIFANETISADEVQAALPGVKQTSGRWHKGASLRDLVAGAEREIVLQALDAN